MELKITGIGDKGNLGNERIGLKAISDCQLKYYQLYRTNFLKSGGFYNRSESVYWFAPEEISAGDRIVVYTKKGTDKVKENDDGTKTFFLYWGLNEAIFTDDNKGVVLVEINSWKTSKGK
ncbi:MAG: hypothetical protein QY303_04320 [Vicingaceae bacterium]|nr:MAG: hypothetical protein QY303_04320 [Vicingaceae bacterium]